MVVALSPLNGSTCGLQQLLHIKHHKRCYQLYHHG